MLTHTASVRISAATLLTNVIESLSAIRYWRWGEVEASKCAYLVPPLRIFSTGLSTGELVISCRC